MNMKFASWIKFVLLPLVFLGACLGRPSYPVIPVDDVTAMQQAMMKQDLKTIKEITKRNKKVLQSSSQYVMVRDKNARNDVHYGYLFDSINKHQCNKAYKIVEYLYGIGFHVGTLYDSKNKDLYYDNLAVLSVQLCTDIVEKIRPDLNYYAIGMLNEGFYRLYDSLIYVYTGNESRNVKNAEVIYDPALEKRYEKMLHLLKDINQDECNAFKQGKRKGKNAKYSEWKCDAAKDYAKKIDAYPKFKKQVQLVADRDLHPYELRNIPYWACRWHDIIEYNQSSIESELRNLRREGRLSSPEVEARIIRVQDLTENLNDILAEYKKKTGKDFDLDSCR